MEFIGYHGTDVQNVPSIKTNNFRKSTNSDEWLGDGVYFFVAGIGDPEKNASEWARNQAYNNGNYKYDKYAVLKAKIKCTTVFDTRSMDGLNAFNELRKFIIDKHNKIFVPNRRLYESDCIIWNMIAEMMKLHVIIHNLYIKDKFQRMKKIYSTVPNTTVMCVKSPDLILQESIETIFENEVTA